MLPTRRSVATQMQTQQETLPPCMSNKDGMCHGQQDAQKSWNILKYSTSTDEWVIKGKQIIWLVAKDGPTGRGKEGECQSPRLCNYYMNYTFK